MSEYCPRVQLWEPPRKLSSSSPEIFRSFGVFEMVPTIYVKFLNICTRVKVCFLASFVLATPGLAMADIIWSGDFSTGDFSQWHDPAGPPPATAIQFWHMPYYGRPVQYGSQDPSNGVGNGDLIELVSRQARRSGGVNYEQGPTRGTSEYALKLTVKSRAGGGIEPDDCDGISQCSNGRRRTALNMQVTHSDYYNAFPNRGTRWFSCSMYLPRDYISGSGWGGPRCGLKPRNEANGQGNTEAVAVVLDGDSGWKLWNRWSDEFPIPELGKMPWQHGMFYAGDEDGDAYPRADHWPQGLAHFPDVDKSHAALKSVNIGGWTDWVFQVNLDSRGAADGGKGFIKVWKREDNGPWVFVLDVVPGTTTRGDMTFDHGIGYDVRENGNNGGYGLKVQLYMKKDQVWNDPHNKVVYFANIKVGDQDAVFSDMSPDGSSPDPTSETMRPLPPTIFSAE